MNPGVQKEEFHGVDTYIGTSAALIAANVVRPEELPGQPGVGRYSACYRPLGVERGDRCWHLQPGYTVIYRLLDDRFRVHINVSDEEAHRRLQTARLAHCGPAASAAEQAPSIDDRWPFAVRYFLALHAAVDRTPPPGLRLVWSRPECGSE
jgi:hypothetical protein